MAPLFDRSHNQRVSRHLAEKYLIELTPEECDVERKKAFQTVRDALYKLGYKKAHAISDAQLFNLMKEALAEKESAWEKKKGSIGNKEKERRKRGRKS